MLCCPAGNPVDGIWKLIWTPSSVFVFLLTRKGGFLKLNNPAYLKALEARLALALGGSEVQYGSVISSNVWRCAALLGKQGGEVLWTPWRGDCLRRAELPLPLSSHRMWKILSPCAPLLV